MESVLLYRRTLTVILDTTLGLCRTLTNPSTRANSVIYLLQEARFNKCDLARGMSQQKKIASGR
jgi:hypothetical protein